MRRRLKDRDLRFTFSNVSAGLALLISLSSGVYALTLPKNSVGSKHIKADAVGESELKSDAVGESELKSDAVGESELKSGAVGSIIEPNLVSQFDNEPVPLTQSNWTPLLNTSASYVAPEQTLLLSQFEVQNTGSGTTNVSGRLLVDGQEKARFTESVGPGFSIVPLMTADSVPKSPTDDHTIELQAFTTGTGLIVHNRTIQVLSVRSVVLPAN